MKSTLKTVADLQLASKDWTLKNQINMVYQSNLYDAETLFELGKQIEENWKAGQVTVYGEDFNLDSLEEEIKAAGYTIEGFEPDNGEDLYWNIGWEI